MIPDNIAQEIKDRADIVDIVGKFLTLKKEGSRLKSCCPFHDERTPSFYVTPSQNMFKCFGCGKGGDGINFLMEHEKLSYPDALKWLGGHYNIPIDGNAPTHTAPQRRAEPIAPTLPPSFTDPATFKATLASYGTNNLVQWLCRKLGQDVVMGAVNEYHVGTAKGGGTIFWQVNHEGKAGTGKIMYYPENDHHRDKSKNPTWTHARTGQTDPTKYNWVKYWFGEHLLPMHPLRTVAIVESEKTALVCSIYFAPLGYVWIANGGKGLAPDKWRALKGRTVILYPDLGPMDEKTGGTPFQEWTGKAVQMRAFGINASVNVFLETRADDFERGQKWDLADFLLMRDLSEVQQAAPTAQPPAKRIEQTPRRETITVPDNAPPTPPQTPQTKLDAAEHFTDGGRLERFTDRMTGERFEVILNADGYPATWNLTADQKKVLARSIETAPPITDLITRFDLKFVGFEPITAESETAWKMARERASAICRPPNTFHVFNKKKVGKKGVKKAEKHPKTPGKTPEKIPFF